MGLKRYVNGVEGEAFYQKRAPDNRPDWIETVELRYPSGRSAHEVVVRDAADLAWLVNLGCVDLHPHPVRADDLEHPDELRVDLDPIPGVPWAQVREVAMVVRDVLADFGLVGWPKTSGSRGLHIFCRVQPRWTFAELRRAGAGAGPRGGGAGARPRHQPLVEGGAARRLRGLQPELQGPHHVFGLLGPADAGRAGVHPAALGRGARLRAGRLHPRHRAGPAGRAGDPADGIDEAVGSLSRCWSWPSATARPGCPTRHRRRRRAGAWRRRRRASRAARAAAVAAPCR